MRKHSHDSRPFIVPWKLAIVFLLVIVVNLFQFSSQESFPRGIPRNLIQVWVDSDKHQVHHLHPSWKHLNPRFTLILFHPSSLLNTSLATSLPLLNNIEVSDFARLHLLHQHGGIYADNDVQCLIPVEKWMNQFKAFQGSSLSTVDLIAGIEFPFPVFGSFEPFQVLTWTLGSSRDNPLLLFVMEEMFLSIRKIPRTGLESVLARTGPVRLTLALCKAIATFAEVRGYRKGEPFGYPNALLPMTELELEGQLLELFMDGRKIRLALFPYRAFGHNPVNDWGYRTEDHRCVQHQFEGTWK